MSNLEASVISVSWVNFLMAKVGLSFFFIIVELAN